VKKSSLATLVLATVILFVDVHEVSARGRFGGGMSYSRPASFSRPAATHYEARTRPVESYHPAYSGGAYHPAARADYRPAAGAAYSAGAYRPHGVYGTAGAVGVVRPRAIGYRTPYLPAGYTALAVGAATYYSYGGNYYSYDDSDQQYTVVQPPLGATVYQLPSGATLVPGHSSLYVVNGVYYRPSYADGAIVYTVSNP